MVEDLEKDKLQYLPFAGDLWLLHFNTAGVTQRPEGLTFFYWGGKSPQTRREEQAPLDQLHPSVTS